MSDHADVVRAGIRIHPDEPTDVMVDLELRAIAALDRLVAERDAALGIETEVILDVILDDLRATEKLATDERERRLSAEAERDEALASRSEILRNSEIERKALQAERDEALRQAAQADEALVLTQEDARSWRAQANHNLGKWESAEYDKSSLRRLNDSQLKVILSLRDAVGAANLVTVNGETKMSREDWLRIEGAFIAAGLRTPVVAIEIDALAPSATGGDDA
jgi:hypothetical protein